MKRRKRTLRVVAAVAVLLALAVTGLASPAAEPKVTMAPEAGDDPAVQLAVGDLRTALTAAHNGPLRWVAAGMASSPIVAETAARYGVEPPALDPEAYFIRPLPNAEPPGALVTGGSPLGVAYGLLALAADVRLAQPYLSYPVGRQASPDFDLRMVSDPLDPRYPGADQALRWGYNAVMTEPWPALALYEAFDPALYAPGRFSTARAWVEAKRRQARAEIQAAKALHLKVYSPGDVILLPVQTALLYGRSVTDGAPTPHYCIESPRVQAMLTAALDELFTTFPEVDGIVVRTGENYPTGPLAGNTPLEGACPHVHGDNLDQTLRLLQEVVVNKYGRQLIYRGWDLGDTGLHSQGADPQRLAAALPLAQNTTLSYKITETDFWRYNRLNRNLLQGDFPRMVELQAAREYEGKGAFPNFVPQFYAQGLPEAPGDPGLPGAHAAGVRGAWVWAKGGGWDGPYLSTPLWVEANTAALGRLLWDVHADAARLAQEWAAERFGKGAASAVAEVLLRSPEAALNGFYFACYARSHGPWTPNTLWVRDDIVLGTAKLRELYDGCGGPAGVDGAIAEKDAALTAVAAMQESLRAAAPALGKSALTATVRSSLEYERTLLEALRHYVAGMFHYFRFTGGNRGDPAARMQAAIALEEAQRAWEAHQATATLPGAPSPYRDAGAVEAMRQALDDLRRP